MAARSIQQVEEDFMHRKLSALALAVALQVPAGVALGERATDLETLVAEALARSPALAAVRLELAARREMEAPAGALPNPMVEAMLQNVGFEATIGRQDMSMLGAEARQALPYPGKRAAARAVAAAESALAEAAVAVVGREVEAAVRTAYARLYALDREREALAAGRELADLLEETVRSRYALGEGGAEGVLRVQIERLRVAERIAEVAGGRSAVLAELNRWLDRPGDAPLGDVATLPEAPVFRGEIGEAAGRAVAGSAEVARAEAAVRLAERRVEVARLALKPDFSAGAGLASRGGLDPVVSARFGIELPIRRRQRQLPLLRASERELDGARAELADAEARARSEAVRQLAAWHTADHHCELLREGLLPLAGAALDAARAAYLAGRGEFSALIDDFDLWLEARVELARQEADRFAARVAYDRIAGPGSPAAGIQEGP